MSRKQKWFHLCELPLDVRGMYSCVVFAAQFLLSSYLYDVGQGLLAVVRCRNRVRIESDIISWDECR
jgi:hypothetical protein